MEALLTEKNVRAMVNHMASVIPVASEVSLPKLKFLVNTDLLVLLKNLGPITLISVPYYPQCFTSSNDSIQKSILLNGFLKETDLFYYV